MINDVFMIPLRNDSPNLIDISTSVIYLGIQIFSIATLH